MLEFPNWKKFIVILVCVWGIFQSAPNFFPEPKEGEESSSFLPEGRVRLGLDLQGGSQLLLQIDFDHFLTEHLDILLGDLRKNFRSERIKYKGLEIKKQDEVIIITFTSIDENQEDSIAKAVKDTSPDLEVIVDKEGQYKLTYNEDYLKKLKKDVQSKSIEIVRRRVDETGTREPIIQMQGDSRILLQVPGLQDPEGLKKLLGKTAKMSFHLMDKGDPYAYTTTRARVGYLLLPDFKNPTQKYHVNKRVAISGELLLDSQPTYDRGQPVVSFRFNNLGGKKFAKITSENVGKPFAVVLDGKVITAPNIQSAILGGSGIITGSFSVEEANELAILLRSGALPAPLSVIEERTVGPSLGADSIIAGEKASLIAVILVIISMVILYKKFGLYSNIAVIFNLILIIAVLSLFEATLTLPGIAGMVLTMGMAVDANVLIFERIREELRLGKTPFAAVDNGFAAAVKTIIDSNITTLIATFLLFTYGTGPIKGFAVTLSVGILCSMFSSIMLTRMLIVLWLKKNKPKTLKI